MHRDDVLDADLAGAHVDLDLRKVGAERALREVRVVRMPSALADHRVVVDLAEDVRERRPRALADDHAGLESELALGRLGRRAEQLLARVARGDPDRWTDRGERDRSRRDRTIGVVGVAQTYLNVVELDAQLVRADLREHGPGAGADVLRPGRKHDRSVRIHVDRRICGWTAAAAPDLGRHADASTPVRRGAADPTVPSATPADLFRADPVALEQVLVGVPLPTHRVLRRARVLAAKGDRVDPDLVGELIDRGLERERALDVAGSAERRQGARIGDDLV